jgi:hypothetical protein
MCKVKEKFLVVLRFFFLTFGVVHGPPVVCSGLPGGPRQSTGSLGRKSIVKLISDT